MLAAAPRACPLPSSHSSGASPNWRCWIARSQRSRPVRPGALLISGEPGIGKTRFLAEAAGRAAGMGFTVLGGSASELERDLPFWIFVDALDEHVADVEPRRLAGLGDDALGELAQLLPALAEHRGVGGPMLRDERYRAPWALRGLLEQLAATRRLVLVLDDVHWADAASVDALTALLRRPPGASVLLVAGDPSAAGARPAGARARARRSRRRAHAHRAGGARSRGGGAAARQRRDDGPRRRPLRGGRRQPVLPRAARAVAGRRWTRTDARRASALDGVGVPRAVVASLGEELDLLTEGTRRVLQGAAVAGDPFEPELAAAAAGVDEPSAIGAFDELLAVGLVRATDVPRRFRFRHPLVRRAVYEGASAAWRLGAHERCAQRLAERGASAANRAHHVEQSARHGDTDALAVLKDAGLHALARAPASAERWISAALRLLPEDAPAQERIDLLLARAGALAGLGRLAEAHADLLESIGLVPASAPGMRVRLVTACAGVEQLLGRHVDAHARLQSALDELPATAAADAIALMLELAKDALFGRRWAAMGEWAGRALASARAAGRAPAHRRVPRHAHARPRDVRGDRGGRDDARRGERAARRDVRRGAQRAHRRGRVPRRRGDLPGSLRRRLPARDARSRAGAGDGQHAPDAGHDAGHVAFHARAARRGRRRARRRDRGVAVVDGVADRRLGAAPGPTWPG